jgi:signal transduction histidine kinase
MNNINELMTRFINNKFSLFIKIPFFSTLSMLIIFGISLLLLYNISREQLKNSLYEQADFIKLNLEYSLPSLIAGQNISGLQRFVENYSSYRNLSTIRIYSPDNEIIASNVDQEIGKKIPEKNVTDILNNTAMKSVDENINKNVFKEAVPIRTADYSAVRKNDIGAVLYFELNVNHMKYSNGLLINSIVFQNIALLIFLLISTTIVIYHFVFKPIMKFMKIIRELIKGNMNFRIRMKQYDEFGSLAALFNNMLDEMDLKNSQLNEYFKNMEEKVNEKTRSLQETNNKLAEAYYKLKSTQSRLVQSDKMASLGQLSAGIAHEINNPISFIRSNLETFGDYYSNIGKFVMECTSGGELKEKYRIDFIMEDLPKIIADSLDGIDRVEKIVKNLKGFSHIDKGEAEYRNINEIIDEILSFASNEIKYKAEVVKNYGNIPDVPCYPQQLGQVFLNIVINASHAIEEKGVIRISTYLKYNYVIAEFEDNGCGIPMEHLFKIFDPFFTTKEVGKGTGLGLSIAYDIIHAHHGYIEVKSEVGKGSVFYINLPVKKHGPDSKEGFNE